MSNVKDYIYSLGNSSQEIFNKLKEEKVVGLKSSSYFCPIANLIKTKFGYSIVSVEYLNIYYGYNFPQEQFNTIEPIRKFLDDFDDGLYPELEYK